MEKVQFTGTNYDEVKRLCGEKLLAPYFCMGFSMLSLDTGEGFVSVYEGDFIVREDDGTLHIEREDSGRKTNVREHGTCFFELYAQIVLSTFLGREYDDLVNRDRPDLQSPDGRSVGIEVTRAMEESKSAGLAMLMDVAGMTRGEDADDLAQVLENGYSFGLWEGRYVGANELPYWSMALPMRRILESKVGKVSDGFYGRFDRMGLFVFSKDDLGAADALYAAQDPPAAAGVIMLGQAVHRLILDVIGAGVGIVVGGPGIGRQRCAGGGPAYGGAGDAEPAGGGVTAFLL